MKTRIFFLTALAMIAFASNSLLCRAALKNSGIDAASFTFIRIASGAIALWCIVRMRRVSSTNGGSWTSAFALFVYAAAFSFAYLDLSAGTGALLLFGAVQATMILWGLRRGERLNVIQVIGFVAAISGLVVLVFPGISAPPILASLLMFVAGIAWGVYSLRGKTAGDAISATAGNFLQAVPFAGLIGTIFVARAHVDLIGAGYAAFSGAITSGLGYVIWYSALPELKATSAAAVQLSVPVLAATGGILLLSEPITIRYLIASIAILGGIALVVFEKNR